MYGGFPVKLTTHIGDAIYPDFLTVDQIREQTLRSMTELIKKNQILPGNILRAIGERFSSENEENILDLIIDSDSKHGTYKSFKKAYFFLEKFREIILFF